MSINNLVNLPLFIAAGTPPDPNGQYAPTNLLAVTVIAIEIVVTWTVVWFFARRPAHDRVALEILVPLRSNV